MKTTATIDPRTYSVRPILEPASRRPRGRGLVIFLGSGAFWTSLAVAAAVLAGAR